MRFEAICALVVGATLISAVAASETAPHDIPQIPKPQIANSAPSAVKIGASQFNAPINHSIASWFAEAEASVPRDVVRLGAYEVDVPNGTNAVKYEFHRAPLKITLSGNSITTETSGGYRVIVARRVRNHWVDYGGCGDSNNLLGLRSRISTTIAWSPQWSIVPTGSSRLITYDSCNVTFLNRNVTNRVNDNVEPKVQDAQNRLQAAILSLKFRPAAESVWRQLQEPFLLDNNMWLMVNPQTFTVAPIVGQGLAIHTAIQMIARPEVVIGDKPMASNAPVPLAKSAAAGNGIHALLRVRLPFDKASELLDAKVAGRQYSIGGHLISIVSTTVYGVSDQIVIRLGVTGDTTGYVYLQGKQSYNTATNVLSASGLKFTTESTDVLLNALVSWLNDATLIADLENAAQWSFADLVNEGKKRLAAGLNRKLSGKMSISGKVIAVRATGIVATDHEFVALVVSDGTASIRLN
jgi:Domain of unknown function (DUF4403)